MKTRFVKDIDASLGQAINLPISNIESIFFESANIELLTGTALTSSIELVVDGLVKQSLQLSDLLAITNILFGKPTYTVSAGSPNDTISLGLLLPLFLPSMPTALNIDSEEEAYIQYRAGNCLSGTLSIYEICSEEDENYLLNLSKFQETGSGRQTFRMAMKNIAMLFIKPRNSADKIQILKDENLECDMYGVEALKLTEIMHRIETGTLDTACIDLVPTGEFTELLSDNVRAIIEHGASGMSTIWSYSAEFIDSRIVKSATKVIAKEQKVVRLVAKQPVLAPIVAEISKIKKTPSGEVMFGAL